ncbi:ATP-binding protein [Streptomyces sp. TRM 70361]|uniref:sensor histidine kinase n=1 Tax=Streptomyces sp. TRM 70361 TaxID=3116553 RepID=UPI002E7C46FB|nr:ATP-binding protein [Streptomyces sp. TRM 70361]MEE1941251.1 ATP-binding protein [Streptomyces sp. TRM 70361]
MLLLVIGCAVVGAELLSRTVARSDDLAGRVQPAQSAASQLQAALLDQETAVRGYALSGDEQFLEPYDQGVREERRLLAELRPLVTPDRELADDLAAVSGGARQWRRMQAEPLIERVQRGEDISRDGQALQESRRQFDGLRALFDVQNRHFDEARDAGRAELLRIRRLRDWTFGVMLAAFIGTGVALAVLLNRMVERPLRRLRVASRRVAGGAFEQRIHSHGPSDLRAVSAAVEDMRRRIVDELEATRSREELLARQTADLDAQASELRRSNAELEQFAYVASHDLQEPLRKVASFCQLLERRYGEALDDRGRQYIDFAVDGATRMQVLINDLLAFSRVGRAGEDPRPVPLDAALDRALANLAAAIEESGARIERPDRLPEVIGDPTTLTMLWQNLIGNAVKFRHPDRPPCVTVTARERDGRWLLGVADNGIGVPPEFAEKIFVIFQRLHSREEYEGTGIGLALCRKIVEQHGGRIELDTDRTEGARILFTLPAARPPAPRPEPPSRSPSPSRPPSSGAPA